MSRGACLACLALLACQACGGGGVDPSPESIPPAGTASLGNGRILITWTVDGATPSVASCGTVDHLSLALRFDTGEQAGIEPIPCDLARFRYDGFPTGTAHLTLTASGVGGCATTSATADAAVMQALPPQPSPTLALTSPRGCP
jgi:hypothetical protein